MKPAKVARKTINSASTEMSIHGKSDWASFVRVIPQNECYESHTGESHLKVKFICQRVLPPNRLIFWDGLSLLSYAHNMECWLTRQIAKGSPAIKHVKDRISQPWYSVDKSKKMRTSKLMQSSKVLK